MKEKRDYVVMNLDNGQYWRAGECNSPKEALEQYVKEINPETSFEALVVEAGLVQKDFLVAVNKPYVIEEIQ